MAGMPSNAAEPQNNACVLDCVVWIIQHRPRYSDARQRHARDKVVEPIARDPLRIIVEKAQNVRLMRGELRG